MLFISHTIISVSFWRFPLLYQVSIKLYSTPFRLDYQYSNSARAQKYCAQSISNSSVVANQIVRLHKSLPRMTLLAEWGYLIGYGLNMIQPMSSLQELKCGWGLKLVWEHSLWTGNVLELFPTENVIATTKTSHLKTWYFTTICTK